MNQRLMATVFASLVAIASPVNVLASEVASQLLPRALQGSRSTHSSPRPWITVCLDQVQVQVDVVSTSCLDWVQVDVGVGVGVDVDVDAELNAVADDRLMDGQSLIPMSLSDLQAFA